MNSCRFIDFKKAGCKKLPNIYFAQNIKKISLYKRKTFCSILWMIIWMIIFMISILSATKLQLKQNILSSMKHKRV